jgi:hypothetical protein
MIGVRSNNGSRHVVVVVVFALLLLFKAGIIFKYSDSRIDFSRKVGLLISRFSFPTPVQIPSRI